uniref:Uncharacterized protein n=1 Tax=Zea mays TaxID=4577 RepID=A0A804UKT9_MAIZE
MSILKQLLQTLQPTENFDDVLSEFQPSLALCNVDYLYCGACDKPEKDFEVEFEEFGVKADDSELDSADEAMTFAAPGAHSPEDTTGSSQSPKLSLFVTPFLATIARYMALVDLEEGNERLFYKLLIDNIEEPLVRPAKRPAPDQLQKALRKTFSAEKKSKIRKAWDGTKVIYNVASWGATAVG